MLMKEDIDGVVECSMAVHSTINRGVRYDVITMASGVNPVLALALDREL